jgi:membrane-associated phospholipid phosphatase
VVLLDVLNGGLLTRFDHAVSARTYGWDLRHGWTFYPLYPLTWFGQRGPVLIGAVPTVAWLCYRSRSLELLGRFVMALLLLAGLVYAFKYGVGRAAPPVDGVRTPDGRSFPSGHLANSVLIWNLLAWYCTREALASPRWLGPTLRTVRIVGPVAVIVGMTLLDYHWISDFLAGVAAGVVLLWLVTQPMPWRRFGRVRQHGVRPSATP